MPGVGSGPQSSDEIFFPMFLGNYGDSTAVLSKFDRSFNLSTVVRSDPVSGGVSPDYQVVRFGRWGSIGGYSATLANGGKNLPSRSKDEFAGDVKDSVRKNDGMRRG